MDTENINIGERIKYLREKNNLTQKNISGFLNVDQSFISKVEKGNGGLSVDALGKLARLDIKEIFCRKILKLGIV